MNELDWKNDALFFTYVWEDETSQFDPEGRWCPGLDCCLRTYKTRLPLAIRDNYELCEMFVGYLLENAPPDCGCWEC
jgi:hypothetical protein